MNVLATWSAGGALTGVIVNVARPAQVSEQEYAISADFWHEARGELRARLGRNLFVLGQCSAAGDQSPHVQVGKAIEERMMMRLGGRTRRQEIGVRIAEAVAGVVERIGRDRQSCPAVAHRCEIVELARPKVSPEDVRDASAEAEKLRGEYESMLRELEEHPERRKEQRWYVPVSQRYRRAMWLSGVARRYELERTQPRMAVELHAVRLGEAALALNPFELYVDFGLQIKARSAAMQTFVVQLAGRGGYLPTARAVAGQSYGAVPASTAVGPSAGRELVEWAVAAIGSLWPE